jgi:hypothetical protein
VRSRRLTLLFALYVALDLSSPFVPGAFNFNPDESIDGVSRHRESTGRPDLTASTPPPAPRPDAVEGTEASRPRPGLGARPRAVTGWLIAVRRAHAPVPLVSALSEDH